MVPQSIKMCENMIKRVMKHEVMTLTVDSWGIYMHIPCFFYELWKWTPLKGSEWLTANEKGCSNFCKGIPLDWWRCFWRLCNNQGYKLTRTDIKLCPPRSKKFYRGGVERNGPFVRLRFHLSWNSSSTSPRCVAGVSLPLEAAKEVVIGGDAQRNLPRNRDIWGHFHNMTRER